MRGKLAIGITANFVNGRTVEETQVPEISGVARIYNQKFFQSLLKATGQGPPSKGLPFSSLYCGMFPTCLSDLGWLQGTSLLSILGGLNSKRGRTVLQGPSSCSLGMKDPGTLKCLALNAFAFCSFMLESKNDVHCKCMFKRMPCLLWLYTATM
jgi:hypothetical protein